MSYAATYPPQATPPLADAPRRPVATQLAAALLLVMAFVGLAYAVVTLVVTPGVIDRFRAAAGSASSSDVDGYVTLVWTFAALGTVLAVVLFALYIVLALGLRRGSNGSRVATWVVSGLGVLVGCGSAIAVGAQRAGDGTPGTLGLALTEAYPQSWIGLNVGLLIAQMAGYLIVALLLVLSPAAFFRRGDDPAKPSQSYVALPTYGSANAYAQPLPGATGPVSGVPGPASAVPGHHPTGAFPASPAFPATAPAFPATPGAPTAQPPYGAPAQSPPGGPVQPPHGAQAPYGAPAQSPYGAPAGSPPGQPPYGAVPQPPAQPPYGAPIAQPPYPGAHAPSAEDQAFWSRPAATEPAAPAPAAAQPTSGPAPTDQPFPGATPAGQPASGAAPTGQPASGAVSAGQAASSAPAPGPSAAESGADAAPPGGRLASEEAAWSDQSAPIPPAAASPTPVAPPYAEPERPTSPTDPNDGRQ